MAAIIDEIFTDSEDIDDVRTSKVIGKILLPMDITSHAAPWGCSSKTQAPRSLYWCRGASVSYTHYIIDV